MATNETQWHPWYRREWKGNIEMKQDEQANVKTFDARAVVVALVAALIALSIAPIYHMAGSAIAGKADDQSIIGEVEGDLEATDEEVSQTETAPSDVVITSTLELTDADLQESTAEDAGIVDEPQPSTAETKAGNKTIGATEVAGTGRLEGITQIATPVDDHTLKISNCTLNYYDANADVGRNNNGWWIGMLVYAPASITADNVGNVYYSNDGTENLTKSFGTNRDNKNDWSKGAYMQVWGLINQDSLNRALQGNALIQYIWKFDWDTTDSTNEIETFQFLADPANITLKNQDGSILWQAQDGKKIYENSQRVAYNVTVTNGKVKYTNASNEEKTEASASIANGLTATLIPDAVEGKEFDKWVVKSGNVSLTSGTDNTAQFTMPAEDIEIEATYKSAAESADELVDATTGIAVEGDIIAEKLAIGGTVELKVTPLGDARVAELAAAYKADNNLYFKTYDIDLVWHQSSGTDVELTEGLGSLKITLPIDNGFNGNTANIVHLHTIVASGAKQELRHTATVANNTATITVDRLSEFVVSIDDAASASATAESGKSARTTSGTKKTKLAQTGDPLSPAVPLGIAIVAVGAVSVAVLRLRKEN